MLILKFPHNPPDRDPALLMVGSSGFSPILRKNHSSRGVAIWPIDGKLDPKSNGFWVAIPKKYLMLLREGTAYRNIEGHVMGRVQTPAGFCHRCPRP